MMDSIQKKTITLINVALFVYAVLIIWLGCYVLSILINRDYSSLAEPSIMMTQFIMAYFPFGWFLLYEKFSKKARNSQNTFSSLIYAYAVGWIISIILWVSYYYTGYAYNVYGRTGGANIGLGFLLMLSPFFITLLMFITFRIASKYVVKNKYL